MPVGIPKNAIPPPQSSGPSEAYPVAVSVVVGGGIAWSCRASLLDLGRTAPRGLRTLIGVAIRTHEYFLQLLTAHVRAT